MRLRTQRGVKREGGNRVFKNGYAVSTLSSPFALFRLGNLEISPTCNQ